MWGQTLPSLNSKGMGATSMSTIRENGQVHHRAEYGAGKCSDKERLWHSQTCGEWVSPTHRDPLHPGRATAPPPPGGHDFLLGFPDGTEIGGGGTPLGCRCFPPLGGTGTPGLGDLWGQEVQRGKQDPPSPHPSPLSKLLPPHMALQVNRLGASVQKWKYLF